ncbi:MAG: hypothetical protein AUG49_15935 [Catenulispora sp. 13_1_20CM_3_70_7]|nr:MAG: hypothetical protein AUG49_15935 [Catenulispora sp. 13_1_20CM_3_70_7]
MTDLVGRFVEEVLAAPELADLVACVPRDRAVRALDLLMIGPAVLVRLASHDEQTRALDALGQAYMRAREGLAEV